MPESGINRSLVYLAILTSIYYCIFVLYPSYNSLSMSPLPYGPKSYVEVTDDGNSVVIVMNDSNINKLQHDYNVPYELANGDKIVLSDGKFIDLGEMSGVKKISLGIPIGVNSAGASELAALPGVGGVIAGRIVSYREKNGKFGSMEELKLVDGIGESKLAGMRNLVNLD